MVKYIIFLGRGVLNVVYGFLKLVTRPKKKVLFLSRQSDSLSIDITMLEDKIKEKHKDYEVVALCKKIGSGAMGKIAYIFHMLRQMYHLATCEVVILDSYAIIVSLLSHRKSLLVIQMWHSVGSMKKFGYSILDKPEGSSSVLANAMKMHRNYDYILCAGEGYSTHLAEGFNYPLDKIMIIPLPRVEALQDRNYSDNVRSRIYEAYPKLKDKPNIVYSPTFRKETEEKEHFFKAVERLKEAFKPYSDKYNLVIMAHPLSGLPSEYKGFSSFDMLFIADYLISDYSCIIYEAAIRHIPLFFFTYDFDSYMSKRDTYIDYAKEIPNDMYESTEELFRAIDERKYDMDRQDAFFGKFVCYSRPHITEDIVDFIWEKKKM